MVIKKYYASACWHIIAQYLHHKLFIDTYRNNGKCMSEQTSACVYNGIEYIITGRSAIKKVGNKTLVELRPKCSGGFQDELNIWVPPTEIYQIQEDENVNE